MYILWTGFDLYKLKMALTVGTYATVSSKEKEELLNNSWDVSVLL
jgi:hypothetical protein